MTRLARRTVPAALGIALAPSAGCAAALDRSAVDVATPTDSKWVRDAAGTNEQAVLFGDPSKPGPILQVWGWAR